MNIVKREVVNQDIGSKSAHAATVEIFKGKPVFAWFEGSREGARDVVIKVKGLFEEDLILGEKIDLPYWNPILYKSENDLYLWGKVGRFCDCWQTFIQKLPSEYNGSNLDNYGFSMIPAGLNGPVKSRPVEFNGKVYCGSSVETDFNWTSYIEGYSLINGSFNFNSRSNPIFVKRFNGRGIIQPTLFKYEDKLFALFRSSKGLNKIYMSHSYDGLYWESPVDTGLKNPNSAIDVAQVGNNYYLIWNPSDSLRYPLQLNRFEINNMSINLFEELTISDEDVQDCFTKELSYPYMISEDDCLHIVYTKGRKYIEYVKVKI